MTRFYTDIVPESVVLPCRGEGVGFELVDEEIVWSHRYSVLELHQKVETVSRIFLAGQVLGDCVLCRILEGFLFRFLVGKVGFMCLKVYTNHMN